MTVAQKENRARPTGRPERARNACLVLSMCEKGGIDMVGRLRPVSLVSVVILVVFQCLVGFHSRDETSASSKNPASIHA